MSEVSAQQVKDLREKTGAGFMDCKAALRESAGDFEGAARTFGEVAERAPDPDRIRAALPARAARQARRRRNGTLVALVAAAGVTAAVVVPIAVLRPDSGATTQVGAPPPATVPAPTGASVPMRFRATWLPPGLAERFRAVALADMGPGHVDGPYRLYTRTDVDGLGNTSGPNLSVQVRKASGASDPEANEGTAITVDGKAGFYHGAVKGDAKAYVEWRADADWVVSVQQTNLGLTQGELLRVANSVQADPATLDIPLHFGWLPDGLSPQFATFSGNNATTWALVVSGEQAQSGTKETDKANRGFTVQLGTATPAPAGGAAIQVDNRAGRLVTRTGPGPAMTYVVVDLGGGRLLTVTGQGGVTDQDLIKIAQKTEVTGDPDLTWLGK